MLNWDANLIYQLLIKTKAKTILIKYEQCEISPYFRSELIKHPLVVKCSKGVHQLNITSLYSISNLLLFPRIPLNHFISCWGGFITLLQHLHRLAAALVGAWHRDALSWSSLRMNPYFDYKGTGIIVWHFQIFNYASVHWGPHVLFVSFPSAFHFLLPADQVHARWIQTATFHGLKSQLWAFLYGLLMFPPNACMALLLFLEDNHSRHALSELTSMPDGH